MTQIDFDDVVVGNGFLGAAIAFELVCLKRRVCLIGAEHGANGRLFAGHHDDSRMLRLYHADPYWEEMSRLNLSLMHASEPCPEIPYFTPTAVRFRGLDQGHHASTLRPRSSVGNALLQAFDLEDEAGGIIEPLQYIAAMNAQSQRLGLMQHRGEVCAVRQIANGCEVETDLGLFTAKRVLHACGFHTAAAIDTLQVVGKVVLFARRPRAESGPVECFIDTDPGTPVFSDIYGFCDYRHDGEAAVSKFGFSEVKPILLEPTQISTWFIDGYRQHPLLTDMQAWVREWHASFTQECHVEPCAFTVTPNRRPGLWKSGSQYWLAGCNGMAAKCCQAVARSAVAALEPIEFPDFPVSLQLPVTCHA